MTNLNSFPIVKAAFQTIAMDRGIPSENVDGNVEPAESALFQNAETALAVVQGKTLSDLNLSDAVWQEIRSGIDADGTYSAFFAVVISADDNDILILKAAGATEEQAQAVRSVLDGFFNGGDFNSNFLSR